jgi:hypothetical protein
VSQRAPGCDHDSVGEASVGLYKRDNALVRLLEFDAEQFSREHAHAHSKNLARAEMLVQCASRGDESLKIKRCYRHVSLRSGPYWAPSASRLACGSVSLV